METDNLADKILDTALEMADSDSWESLHLYAIAEKLNLSLDQIRQYYAQKDDLVEAWFDRADKAVLNTFPTAEFIEIYPRERLQKVIMSWLQTLAPYRRITREMLMYKFEFGHIHLQTLGVMRISRTVQWFREAAQVDTTGLRRILEETGTTTIYLMTFRKWLYDNSSENQNTHRFLEQALLNAEKCAQKLGFD